MTWAAIGGAVAASLVSSAMAPSPGQSAPGVSPTAQLPNQPYAGQELFNSIFGGGGYSPYPTGAGTSPGAAYYELGGQGMPTQPSPGGFGIGFAGPAVTPAVASMLRQPSQAYAPAGAGGGQPGYMGRANQYAGMDPAYANQAFQALYNNPYAGGMQASAGQAGAMAGQFAPAAAAYGMGALGAGQQALGAGQQVFQTAFDPQQALYNRLQNQVEQQANVANSMYGLGGSPAGAAAANQAMGNFNIDWQNQQLARQLQGQQALNAGINAYTGAGQQGLGLGATGIALQQQAGMLPYQTAQAIGQGQFGAIGANQQAMQNAMQQYQQYINNMLAYTGAGQAAQAQANQQAMQQQALQQQQIGGLAQFGTQLATSYLNRPRNPSAAQAEANTAAANYAMAGGAGATNPVGI